MPIKTLAITAVLSATALPVSLLGVHAYQESQIPQCSTDMPTTIPICSEQITGMKYTPDHYRKLSS